MDIIQVQFFQSVKDWLVGSEVRWALNRYNIPGPPKLLHTLLIRESVEVRAQPYVH